MIILIFYIINVNPNLPVVLVVLIILALRPYKTNFWPV